MTVDLFVNRLTTYFSTFEEYSRKMKKIHLALIALIGLVSLQSCKDDIEITGEFVETAVVFGLLDQADSLQFIKITRAFIGPGNAFDIAQIPDSNYFNSVTGTVTELSTGRKFTLRDTIVLNKDVNGLFYAPEQKLYYFDNTHITSTNTTGAPLDEASKFRLDLNINNGLFSVTGETELITGLSSNISGQTQPYKFVDNQDQFKSTTITVSQSGTGNHLAHRLNTTVEINIEEFQGATATPKKFMWNLGDSETSNTSVVFTAPGNTFYELTKSNCTNNSAITKRSLISMNTIITGGSEVLNRYIASTKPTSGLAQSKPVYTNLEASGGHPVVGIFSARSTIRIDKVFYDPTASGFVRCLDKISTAKLCQGSVTGPFLFCSQHTADSAEPWFCP
jgi:hypothetical protein